MNLSMDWRGGLERLPALLENLVARINTVWKKQHTAAGTHQNLSTNSLRVGTYTGTPPGLPLHLLSHPEMLVVDGSAISPTTQIQLASAGPIDVFTNGAVQFAGTANGVFRFHASTITFLSAGITITSDGTATLNSLFSNAGVSAVNGTGSVTGSDVNVQAADDVQITAGDDIFLTAGGDVDINSATNVLMQNIANAISMEAPDIVLFATDDINITAVGTLTLGSQGTPIVLTDGQLQFPATQNPSADAHTLDDYEEGTWTPTLAFGGSSAGITYSSQQGIYVKVGQNVIAYFRLTLTSKGAAAGGATIEGLPIGSTGAIDGTGGAAYSPFGSGFTGIGVAPPTGYVAGTAIVMTFWTAAGVSGMNDGTFTNTTDLIMQATYKAGN